MGKGNNLIKLPVVYYDRREIKQEDIQDENARKSFYGWFNYIEKYKDQINNLMTKTYNNLEKKGNKNDNATKKLEEMAKQHYKKEMKVFEESISYDYTKGNLTKEEATAIRKAFFNVLTGQPMGTKTVPRQEKTVARESEIFNLFFNMQFYKDINKVIASQGKQGNFVVRRILVDKINKAMADFLMRHGGKDNMVDIAIRQRKEYNKDNDTKVKRKTYGVKNNIRSMHIDYSNEEEWGVLNDELFSIIRKIGLSALGVLEEPSHIGEEVYPGRYNSELKLYLGEYFGVDNELMTNLIDSMFVKRDKNNNIIKEDNAFNVRIIDTSGKMYSRSKLEKAGAKKNLRMKKELIFSAEFLGVEEFVKNIPLSHSETKKNIDEDIADYLLSVLDTVIEQNFRGKPKTYEYYTTDIKPIIRKQLCKNTEMLESFKTNIENMISLQSAFSYTFNTQLNEVNDSAIAILVDRIKKFQNKHIKKGLRGNDKTTEYIELLNKKDIRSIQANADMQSFLDERIQKSIKGHLSSIKGAFAELLIGALLNQFGGNANITGSKITAGGYMSMSDIIVEKTIKEMKNNREISKKYKIGIQIKAYDDKSFSLYNTKIHLNENKILQKYYGVNRNKHANGFGGALGLQYLLLNATAGNRTGFNFSEKNLINLSKMYITYFLRIQDFLENEDLQNDFFILGPHIIPTSVLLSYVIQKYKKDKYNIFETNYKPTEVDEAMTQEINLEWFDHKRYRPRLVSNNNMLDKLSDQYIEFKGVSINLNKIITNS